jgi:hypothetical protein
MPSIPDGNQRLVSPCFYWDTLNNIEFQFPPVIRQNELDNNIFVSTLALDLYHIEMKDTVTSSFDLFSISPQRIEPTLADCVTDKLL